MHVVHVEDDRPLKEILRVALQAREPKLQIAQYVQADEALPFIGRNRDSIDLFILDIRLPGTLSGLQLARIIREMRCPGSIVLTSAYARPTQEVLKALGCDYYPKPWHLMELTQKLLEYRLPTDSPPPGKPAGLVKTENTAQ